MKIIIQKFRLNLIIILSFCILLGCSNSNEKPTIKNGILDLRNINISEQTIILTGDWNFYWKKFLDPKNPQEVESLLLKVPGYWNGLEVNNEKLSGNGYGTYQLKVLLPPNSRNIAIRTQMLSTAYRLYINGTLVIKNGTVGKNSDSSIPDSVPASNHFISEHDELDIVIHVSNFHHRKGGASRELLLGSEASIMKYDKISLAINLFMIGSIFVMGFYHIGFYFNRKKDKSPLYFSLFCFVIAIRDLVTNEIFLKQLFPSISWEIIEKLRYLTFYLCVPIFSYFLELVFTKHFPKKFLKFVRLVGFTTPILVILTPATIYTYSSIFYEYFTIIIISMAIYYVYRAARDHQMGAYVFLIGFIVLFSTAINDILVHEGFITTSKDLTPFGLLFFIITQALLISKRFARALTDVEALSGELEVKSIELSEKNVKLQNFGDRMEVLVKKRTAALKNTLKEVEEAQIKVMDSLNYSKIIQTTLLPDKEKFQEWLPNSFFIWKPKDIVGGDIVFAEYFGDKMVLAVIDCTGHGVPGAFMTMVACSGLHKIIDEHNCNNPGEILRQLNVNIKSLLRQDIENTESDNGLEASVCLIDFNKKSLTYSGARLPLFYVQNDKFHVIKGDRESIGYKRSNLDFSFTNHHLENIENMRFYLCTDGYIQQLGGEKNISFSKKRLSQLLLEINKDNFDDQKYQIMQAYHEYRGKNEIQDDVTLIGFQL